MNTVNSIHQQESKPERVKTPGPATRPPKTPLQPAHSCYPQAHAASPHAHPRTWVSKLKGWMMRMRRRHARAGTSNMQHGPCYRDEKH
jgi:hypothetical protein